MNETSLGKGIRKRLDALGSDSSIDGDEEKSEEEKEDANDESEEKEKTIRGRKCVLMSSTDGSPKYAVIGATEHSLIIAFKNITEDAETFGEDREEEKRRA